LGRLAGLGQWLKQYLVKVLIYRSRELDIRFKRTIEFGEQEVRVHDMIGGADGKRIESLRWGKVFTTIHMGSSRYFIHNELDETSLSDSHVQDEIDLQQISSGLALQRIVTFR
jgi:hypothetical protein